MRWKAAVGGVADASTGVPDALAVYDEAGELIGWDGSATCAYLAERGHPCDADCQARGHIDPW